MNRQETIRHLLKTSKTIAVVGLSPKPHRESFGVSKTMQSLGYRIIPINPLVSGQGGSVLGEKAYASLTEAAQHERIDLVNIFRNSEDVPPVVDEAIAIGAPAVWMQMGIAHAEATAKAEAAGLLVVETACLKVEFWRAKAG
ncbi:MAG: CoA-binding protein [Pseudomonadota bacterium]